MFTYNQSTSYRIFKIAISCINNNIAYAIKKKLINNGINHLACRHKKKNNLHLLYKLLKRLRNYKTMFHCSATSINKSIIHDDLVSTCAKTLGKSRAHFTKTNNTYLMAVLNFYDHRTTFFHIFLYVYSLMQHSCK